MHTTSAGQVIRSVVYPMHVTSDSHITTNGLAQYLTSHWYIFLYVNFNFKWTNSFRKMIWQPTENECHFGGKSLKYEVHNKKKMNYHKGEKNK